MNSEQPRQKLPFAAEKDSSQFFQEVIRLLIKEFDNRRKKYVPTENFQVFHHGAGWNFQRQEKEGFKPHSGELEKVSPGFLKRVRLFVQLHRFFFPIVFHSYLNAL